ncbi:4'-phosphopantetheinyl transferase superfamily protein [Marinobacter nauticus]
MQTPEPVSTQVFLCDSGNLLPRPEEHEQALRLLGPSEQTRLTQYQGRRYREFLQTRLLLRQALSTTIPGALPPEHWQISERPEQAPLVHQAVDLGWHYSLSHSRGRIAIAISNAGPCGIDLEHHRPRANLMALAEQWFHPDETGCLASLDEPDQIAAFYRLWTMKEALIKATDSSVFSGILANTRFKVCDNPEPLQGVQAHSLALPKAPFSLAIVCAGQPPLEITDGYPLATAERLRPTLTSFAIDPAPSLDQATSGRSM